MNEIDKIKKRLDDIEKALNNPSYAASLLAKLASKNTEKFKAASRENGKKGGRPRSQSLKT